MALTFTTLKQAIQDYCESNETTFVANLPLIIRQAEDRILKNVQLPDFRKNVIPTMWADPSLMLNASGTSYSLLSAGRMAGILSSVAKVPVVAAVTGAEGAASQMSRSASMNDALNAISQYTIRSNKPLLSVGGRVPFTNKRVDVDVLIPADASRAGQTVVREPVVEEDDVETSPAVLGILDSIDASTREKIMATQPR